MSLLTNLISYWKLNEASGNAIDSHGSNTLTDENTVGTATGKISNARDFEASSAERFFIASNASLQTGDVDFTISFWMKPETVGSFTIMVNKSGVFAADREYAVYNSFGNQLTFFIYDPAGNIINVNSGVSPVVGNWYHVIAWHDSVANQIAISVNNATPATTPHSTGVRVNNFEFELGSRKSQGIFYDGLLDEVGFWKRTLTPPERTALYNGGNGLSYDAFGGGNSAAAVHFFQFGF